MIRHWHFYVREMLEASKPLNIYRGLDIKILLCWINSHSKAFAPFRMIRYAMRYTASVVSPIIQHRQTLFFD